MEMSRLGRIAEDRHFATHDGLDLFYRYWPALSERPAGAVVLFHRGHEHSGRMAHLVDELNLPNHAFFAWDARGHGLSPGPRGFSPSLGTSVRDVETFIDHIGDVHGFMRSDIAIVAQSVGAVLASTWVHDYAPSIRALVLASPAFKVRLYVPFARAGLALMRRLRGNFFVNSYVKPRLLTHDPDRITSYQTDPLITRPISVNILLALYDTADRVVADAGAITVPTQLLISGNDWVVDQKPQHAFFDRLESATKQKHVLDGFFHDTLGEKDRSIAVHKARAFIVQQFAAPVETPSLLDADRQGYTRQETDRLTAPLSIWSPRGLYWAATRLGLKIAGRMSAGIALGIRAGFDSGSTLDYVYRNQPDGVTALGRLIDRSYLNSAGWRGIRQRKRDVEALLCKAMDLLRDAGLPVRVLDIAAGHGRYILDALQDAEVPPESILLRDYSAINVAAGTNLIAERGLSDTTRFVAGDAFDADDLAAVEPWPTLGVVSGLYELYSDNDRVRRSLAGLAAAIPVGGYLVYTNQPWHPQLAFIARALTSHRDGQAWIMRRRTQAEMDQLAEVAGFIKIDQRIDEDGIFTVSLARRKDG